MKYLILSIFLFLVACTNKNKNDAIKPWKTTHIQYGMNSCMKSLRQFYDKKFENDEQWNGSRVALHCGCTVDHLRKNISQEYFIINLRKNNLGDELKQASDYCKNKNGNWFGEV